MKQSFLLLAMLLITCIFCEKNTNPILGFREPRDYIWTVDTLTYPESIQTLMRSIWGSSSNNVYVVGHNDGSSAGMMFRYNGRNWNTTRYHSSEGGNIQGRVDLNDIFGFSANDIWCCGDRNYRSFIMYFDGTEWTEIGGLGGHILEYIWGVAPDDVWFGGINGTLFHWDGISMKKDSLSFYIPKDADPFWNIQITGNQSGLIYLLLTARPSGVVGQETYYFFHRTNDQWFLQDSLKGVSVGKIWTSPSGRLYRIGDEVQFYENNIWHTLFLGPVLFTGISGITDDNIFVGGQRGYAFQYNGVDWYQYKELEDPDVTYGDIWSDGKEVFYVGRLFEATHKTIVAHGK